MLDRGAFWLPRAKWGPISWGKLTHEVFRVALPRLQAQIEALHARVSQEDCVGEYTFYHMWQTELSWKKRVQLQMKEVTIFPCVLDTDVPCLVSLRMLQFPCFGHLLPNHCSASAL